jgi:hypothetical protein
VDRVQVMGFNRSQPQYAYAVGAIALVLLQLCVQRTYKAYRHFGRLERSTMWAALGAEAVTLTFGT